MSVLRAGASPAGAGGRTLTATRFAELTRPDDLTNLTGRLADSGMVVDRSEFTAGAGGELRVIK